MEIRTILLAVTGTALFICGIALDHKSEQLTKEQAAHNETTIAYSNFRDQQKKISENMSLHYERLLDEASKTAAKELAAKDLSLSSAKSASAGLQLTIAGLRTRLQSASCEAAKESAAVSGELLGACQRALVWFSNQADGHRIDANKFDNSWPTEAKPTYESK